jgi:hypothetical protein
MEKNFSFNNGEIVTIKKDFNSENNTFVTKMMFKGEDEEEKHAAVSFQKEEERDIMFENYSIETAIDFANFIR